MAACGRLSGDVSEGGRGHPAEAEMIVCAASAARFLEAGSWDGAAGSSEQLS